MRKKQGLSTVYFSVTNDLTGDQRVHRIISTLVNSGLKVELVGRRLPESLPLEVRRYSTRRLRLLFRKGFLFYACFNFRLFLYLVSRRSPQVFVSNDLDTLPANFLASRIRRRPLVYDSHEYFTEVPELAGRERVRRIWLALEEFLFPHVNAAYSVSEPIARAYSEKYGIKVELIRNFPLRKQDMSRSEFPFNPEGKKVIIYQGAVNVGRGLELLIDAVEGMEDVMLLIAGDGDIRVQLEKDTESRGLGKKVVFMGKIPFEKLHSLTCRADAGVSIEEDRGLNYRYAMPNKLFDYIQAGIPVLVSDLPEMKKIVESYNIGLILTDRDPASVRIALQSLLFEETLRSALKTGLSKAAEELCWEKEEERVRRVYSGVMRVEL